MWLDTVIAGLSPRWGLRRARARIALDAVRGYDGAKASRSRGGWASVGTSASAEALPALRNLIAAARELVRNDPHARKAVRGLTNSLVGTGVVPKWTDTAAKADWDAWAKKADAAGGNFGGLQRIVARAWMESGGVILRRRYRKAEDGLLIPMQIQVMEIDHLDTQRTESLATGGRIIGGVEFDPIERISAYWLFPVHPGEVGPVAKALTSVRVPAEDVIHLFERERPGAVHGLPRLSSVITWLRDRGDIREALLVRRKIEACFAAFVEESTDGDVLGETSKDGDNKVIETMSPGMIQYLRPGQKVSFGTPQAGSGEADQLRSEYQGIAAGLGITYERLTGDLSQTNYSSIRAGEITYREEIEALQWTVLVPVLLERVAEWFAEARIMAGRARQTIVPDSWTTPPVRYVDPSKEIAGNRNAIEGALKSLSSVIREAGEDPDAVFAEIADERTKLAKLGITVAPTNGQQQAPIVDVAQGAN